MSRTRPGRAAPKSTGVDAALQRAAELHRRGDLAGALPLYEAVLRDHPAHAEGCRLMSLALRAAGQAEAARGLAQRAIDAAPRSPLAHAALGEALAALGRDDEAVAALRASLALGQDVGVMAFLGNLLLERHELEEAERWLDEALKRQPRHAPALFYLATLAAQTSRPVYAQQLLERFLQTGHQPAVAFNNLGKVLQDQGLVDRAIEAYRHAVSLDPNAHDAYGNLLHALLLSDRYEPKQVFEEHVRRGLWLFSQVSATPRARTAADDRPLRVGYLSPDFREHPVARFVEPLLRHHDAARVHVTCYHDSAIDDAVTRRLRSLPSAWRDVSSMNDEALVRTIVEDGIDILVDLAVNSGGNRQAVFARRAAPLQISYLGYAATTGLPTMDYRLTDATVDPPGQTEKLHTERLLRLPDVIWCYQPPAEAPDIVLDSREGGDAPIRFGSPSRLAKICDRAIDAWCEILRAVPGSRLRLQAGALGEATVRDAWAQRFATREIDPSRLELCAATPTREYLASFNEVDVALDTFPFCGGTTSCNALWMGCPVITLAETPPWSRVSASVLGALGLSRFVARTVDEYVAKAVALANAPAERAELRRTLRVRFAESPLTDAPRFARAVEAAYRLAWSKR
jgi:predicted O-linked N-acetylglucosamine transferase (SPINDLY family)